MMRRAPEGDGAGGARWGWTDTRLTLLALGAILVLAILPRVLALGAGPIWIDEDLTWLATHAVIEEGVPRLPSGMIYERAPLFTYLAAGFLAAGDGITALRLPSVFSSIALIVVVFLFGRSIGGRAVGITAALVIALSPWDVHYARMARMYELLALLYTLTVFLAYRGLMKGSRGARVGMLITAALTVATHQQGATLAAVFLSPILFPRAHRPPIRWMLAGVLVTGIAFKLSGQLGTLDGATLHFLPRKEVTGILSFPVIGALDLNHARFLLLEVFRASAPVGAAAATIVLGLGAWVVKRLLSMRKVLATATAIGFVAALLANQLVFAVIFALLTIKLAETTVSGGIRCGMDLAILGGGAILITLGAVALTLGADALSDRMVLRSFFALPVPWYKRLFQTYPIMFVVVLAGIGVHYLRALRPRASHDAMFLVLAFAVPLIGQGLVFSPYFGYRYNFYLSPLMVITFAMSVVPIVSFLTAAMEPRARRLAMGTSMLGVSLVLLCDAFDPVEAYGIRSRDFGYNRDRFDHPDVTASYNYDYPGTAAYVKARREPGDVVIARDPVNLYPYLGPSDYLVSVPHDGRARNEQGEIVDWYLGIPYLVDVESLYAILERHAGVNRWIIYTTSAGADGPHTNLTDRQLAYLTAFGEYRVFTGRDGTTVVLRLPAGLRVPPPPGT